MQYSSSHSSHGCETSKTTKPGSMSVVTSSSNSKMFHFAMSKPAIKTSISEKIDPKVHLVQAWFCIEVSKCFGNTLVARDAASRARPIIDQLAPRPDANLEIL